MGRTPCTWAKTNRILVQEGVDRIAVYKRGRGLGRSVGCTPQCKRWVRRSEGCMPKCIQPKHGDDQVDAGRDCRTLLERPDSQARTGTGKKYFSLFSWPRTGLATLPGWSLPMLYVMTIHTYIQVSLIPPVHPNALQGIFLILLFWPHYGSKWLYILRSTWIHQYWVVYYFSTHWRL